MSIEKTQIIDKIEIVENGTVQVRTAVRILENGTLISQSYIRHVIVPGQDYSQEDSRVQSICALTHTPAVITAYASK